MKIDAIVYTSQTGYTREYAQMLAQTLELPTFALGEAQLPKGSDILYMGCIHMSRVKGFSKAKRRFTVRAVCGVGLCDTGTMTAEVRKATAIDAGIPLFTLQGGIDRSRLAGVNKLVIDMLEKGLSDQKQRSAQDERILALLRTEGSHVSTENLRAVLDWYRTEKTV